MNPGTRLLLLALALALSCLACESGAVLHRQDAATLDWAGGDVAESEDTGSPGEDTPTADTEGDGDEAGDADVNPQEEVAGDADEPDDGAAEDEDASAPPEDVDEVEDEDTEEISEQDAGEVEEVTDDVQPEAEVIPPPEPDAVVASDTWAAIERYGVNSPALMPELFIDKIRHTDAEVVQAFGASDPTPDRVLLHLAEGWDVNEGAVVVLVHGAGSNATQSFVAPGLLGEAGLAPRLSAAGHRVFGVTYAHPFGSNRQQAVQLARALEVIRAKTGEEQVTLIAHSKGGLSALAYVQDMMAAWGAGYAGDVARLVLLAAPLGGTDWSFRHPNVSYAVDLMSLATPTAWYEIYEYFMWKDITEQSIYGGAYNGLLESLTPWIDAYTFPLPAEQDFFTTYYGGPGVVSKSHGIFEAIELGGWFMDELRALPFPADIEVAVAAGGSALIGGAIWETSGPSDGLVFEASATDTTVFEAAGATILDTEVFGLVNHWDMLYKGAVMDWVEGVLAL